MTANGLPPGAVADLKAENCQPALMPNRIAELELTTSPAIELNGSYSQPLFQFRLNKLAILSSVSKLENSL